MDMQIGIFFGVTLTVGMLTAVLTQGLKLIEPGTPAADVLGKIPGIKYLIELIVPENNTEIRIFVAILCFGLSALGQYLTTGALPTLNIELILMTIKSFFDATAGYVLILQKTDNVKKEETE